VEKGQEQKEVRELQVGEKREVWKGLLAARAKNSRVEILKCQLSTEFTV